jgi:UDP-2,3-diacylglucosamine pyrophosphatase LpxH
MISIDDFIRESDGKTTIYRDYRAVIEEDVTDRLTVCIPDMHLLEKSNTDDFYDGKEEYVERFLNLLRFLAKLKDREGDAIDIIQLGDMYDLWQARGNTNLIVQTYPDIIGFIKDMGTVYLAGNHDIDLIRWYKHETFGRKWTHYSTVGGEKRVMYEHGFQADFFNNQANWSGAIGKEITQILGLMEHIDPDADVALGGIWDSVSRAFSVYNSGLTPVKNPDGFNSHEYFQYYLAQMEKFNHGDSDDHHGKTDLYLAVIGHTHIPRMVKKPRDDRAYYLMDCGSWVDGGHEVGLISGKEIAICQWG